MIIQNFHKEVVAPYEQALDLFFDGKTGAVKEPGRANGTPAFLFTEVTGYALLDYLTLHALTANDHYIDKANHAAKWIYTQAQDDCGGVLTRYFFERDEDPELARHSFANRRIYAFDTAICLRGMINLYDFTGDAEQLESAIRMGDFMVDRLMNDAGEVTAIFDAKADAPIPADDNVWSQRFSSFHTKCAEALIDLYRSTQLDKYKDAAIAICEAATRFQQENGAIETSLGKTELHPHCYATEGFLHVGMLTGREDLITVARRATEWALDRCQESGEISQSIDLASDQPLARFRTDSLAQVLALGSDLRQMGQLSSDYDSTLDRLAKKVLEMRTGPGGWFRYGFFEQAFGGSDDASETMSYWTQMFCLRGFTRYYKSHLVGRTSVTLLAGGIGSRLWPISCENRPKPVSMSLLGDRSLLQETIRRYTNNHFIPPENIHILCSKNAVADATSQAAVEGVPTDNCVIEKEPRGTVPAVSIALDGLPPLAEGEDRLIVISMGDNVIDPHWSFQNALVGALIAAEENDCIVSIGKPADKTAEVDTRFGHHFYRSSVEGYRAFQVDQFVEKPDADRREEFSKWSGSLAWECGTVIFKESVFRALVPPNPESGNLAEDLLAKALPWDQQGDSTVKLATALLDPRTRFEDFGVPGRNIQNFYAGHPECDFGDGNICIGRPDLVQLLGSSGCLVIADELPVRLYGVRDLVVVDNAVTNTTVVLPADDVHRLPALYRLFSGSNSYEAFIAGGEAAQTAEPTTFVERSPLAHAKSEKGLVFAYQLDQRVTIKRTEQGLIVSNDDFPALKDHDFTVLANRHADDPRLVDQMINVGTVARSLLGGEISLSEQGREILDKLCLYHVYGGVLTEAGEQREIELRESFAKASQLDRRLLDTRVVQAMLGQSAREVDEALISANVSSAVAFIEQSSTPVGAVRDAVVGIIQAQDSTSRLAMTVENLKAAASNGIGHEIEIIAGLFKTAQTLVNGRWLWKRHRVAGGADAFLRHHRGAIEELPFTLKFAATWLSEARLNPRPLLNRVNHLLVDERSPFNRQIQRLQEEQSGLVCDALYARLLSDPNVSLSALEAMLDDCYDQIVDEPANDFQIVQLMELPQTLAVLRTHCDGLSESVVDTVRDAIAGFYHRNWKVLERRVDPSLIGGLISARQDR